MTNSPSESPFADGAKSAPAPAAAPEAPGQAEPPPETPLVGKPQRLLPRGKRRGPPPRNRKPDAPAAEAATAPPPAPMRPGEARRPFGVPRKKLELTGTRPGYVPRWINDEPGRVDAAKAGGYEHIRDGRGKPISRVVDRRTGLLAYAMEIPKEFYDADFALKQKKNDEIDDAIMNRAIADKGYRPTVGGTLQPRTQAQVIRGRQPVASE